MRPGIDETHDPELVSWVESANGHSDFPIQNLPFGLFVPPGGSARIGVAIGNSILDLRSAAAAGTFRDALGEIFRDDALNRFFALDPET